MKLDIIKSMNNCKNAEVFGCHGHNMNCENCSYWKNACEIKIGNINSTIYTEGVYKLHSEIEKEMKELRKMLREEK